MARFDNWCCEIETFSVRTEPENEVVQDVLTTEGDAEKQPPVEPTRLAKEKVAPH